MELIRGIAGNVRDSTGAGTIDLDIDGRDVRLEKRADDNREDDGADRDHLMVARQQEVKAGDDLIVAGQQKAGAVVGYAYRNITQGYGRRASCRNDAFQALLTLFISIGAFWYSFAAHSDIPLFFWIQRVTFFAFALLFAVCTVVLVIIIVEKFLAGFRVNRAALETMRGTARNVRLSTDCCGAYLDIDAHCVGLFMARKIAIADGDEVIIVGQRTGDVLTGFSYHNLTRGVAGRRWTVVGPMWTLLWMGALLASLTGLWFGGEDAAIFIAIRRALALAFMMAILVFALDRFFRWRLDWEAWRRVRAGPR
jgi:hypothetical protein